MSARRSAFAVWTPALNLLFLTSMYVTYGSTCESQLLPTDGPDRSPRVSAALDRTTIFVGGPFPPLGMDETTTDILEDLQSIVPPHRRILVEHMAVGGTDFYADYLEQWAPILRFFDPISVNFQAVAAGHLPSTVHVPHHAVASLLSSWTRLKGVTCYGPGSVPLFEPLATDPLPFPAFSPSRFALRDVLCVSKGRDDPDCIGVSLSVVPKEQGPGDDCVSIDTQDVEESEVEEALARAAEHPPDPSQFHVGLTFE